MGMVRRWQCVSVWKKMLLPASAAWVCGLCFTWLGRQSPFQVSLFGKNVYIDFFPTQNCWTVLMATEKILTYTTLSAFFLPGGNRHACLGGEVALIPEGGDPGVTMAHDTVTCNMFARAREGSPYHLFSSSCWVVGTWRMFMSCLGFCLHLKACSWRL